MREKYKHERLHSQWERSKLEKKQEPKPKPKQIVSIVDYLNAFLKEPMDKKCCEFLSPELDLSYKGGTEMAVILHTDDDVIAIEDIVRFIHAIIVGKYFKGGSLINKPLNIIVRNGKRDKIFEVIASNTEIGTHRQGISILRTEGYLSKPGIVDIIIQRISPDAHHVNADNFAYQLSVLSNGKPHALYINNELIKGAIFQDMHDNDEEENEDGSLIGGLLIGVGICALAWLGL